MVFRVTVVQPLREKDEDVDNALEYLDRAVGDGARLICFPEGYPGPWQESLLGVSPAKQLNYRNLDEYASVRAFSREAKSKGVYIAFGLTEVHGGNYYNSYLVASPSGELVAKHRKTTPAAFEVAADGRPVTKGDKLKVFEIEGIKVGILICWEALFPELSRVLALKGAEVLLFPTGGKIYELLDTWRTVIWARAIDNLAYVTISVNLYGKEKGLSMIAGPEDILAENDGEGVISADLDLERLQWLRKTDEELTIPKKYKCVPGLFKYRRPELYRPIVE